MNKKYAALIALDWADKKHDGCLQVKGASKTEAFKLTHSAKSIATWVKSLRERFPNSKFGIILEQKRGAVISALLKYDCFEIYPVNPATLAKYREAFAPSGAKDDPTDAALMLELLQLHPDRVPRWIPEDKQTRELGILVEQRRVLVNDRKRLGNRLTSLLKCYYPLVLELFPRMGRAVLCNFVLKYPNLEVVQKASEKELIEFFRSNRSANKLEEKIGKIKESVSLTEDSATINTSVMMAETLSMQILLLVERISLFEKRIEALFSTHKDSSFFASLPASGENMAPRLLIAFGADRNRFKSANDMQCFLGIAPVTERSGNSSWIHWRYNCSKFTRQSIHEWAGITIRHSLWARAYYAMQRSKGKSHPIAVRALAFKWIRILFRIWKDRKTYCETTYLAALQRNGSPIIKFLAENPNLEKLKFSTLYT